MSPRSYARSPAVRCSSRCGTALKRPVTAAIACASLTLVLASSAPAAAAEEGALGFPLAFGYALGLAGAATPYLALSDGKDPGYASLSLELGAGRRLDAFAIASDLGGYLRRGGDFGWMGRTRMDIAGADPFAGGSIALRIDSLALFRLAGAPADPLFLEALGGLTLWPRFDTSPTGDLEPFLGVGPLVGLRTRATAGRPWVYGEVETAYAPLFGAPPTGRVHHVELGPALGVTPWPTALFMPAFEARARFEVGLGEQINRLSTGVTLVLGMRLRLDKRNDRAQ